MNAIFFTNTNGKKGFIYTPDHEEMPGDLNFNLRMNVLMLRWINRGIAPM
jgi:hypothetical protein